MKRIQDTIRVKDEMNSNTCLSYNKHKTNIYKTWDSDCNN